MKIIRLIIVACVLFALIVPLDAFAQSGKFYGDVKGTVNSQAFRVNGAKVTLYSMDPVSHVQDEKIAETTTNSQGEFSFPYVAFDVGRQFQFMVRAEKGSDVAIAWVYALDKEGDIPVYVSPLNLDLSVPSQTSEATVTVWSTEGQVTSHSNLVPVPGVKLTLYSLDPASGNRTQLYADKVTNSAGQYTFNIPYGTYVVRAEKSGMYGEQSFPVYQQISTTSVSTNMPVPAATPTPAPGATTTPGGTSTPGFEAVFALIALIGGALYLRRA